MQSDYGNWCEFTVFLPCDSGNRRPMGAASIPNSMTQDISLSENSDDSEGENDSDEETCTSIDSSDPSSGGLSSTTSFQQLVHEAARRQARDTNGDMRNQEVNPLAPTAVASLHKLRTHLLSSSSLKSGSTASSNTSSLGFGSKASSLGFNSTASTNGMNNNGQRSITSMRNVQFQTQFSNNKSPKNQQNQQHPNSNVQGLAAFSGRTGSFGQLGNALGTRHSGGSARAKARKLEARATGSSHSHRSGSMKIRKPPALGSTGQLRSTGRSSSGGKRVGSGTSQRRGSGGITGGTIALVGDKVDGGGGGGGITPMIIPENKPTVVDKSTVAIPKKRSPEEEKTNGNSNNNTSSSTTAKPKAKGTTTATAKEASTTESENRMASIKVLVAEDNKINQKVLKRTLMRVGINEEILDIVENGKLAVEASDEKVYDIIFMDMQMPIMDGLEATSIISQRQIHPKIVFLTAHALSEYQEKAIEAGGDCFISKPFKLAAIKETIETLVLAGMDDEREEEEEESEEEI